MGHGDPQGAMSVYSGMPAFGRSGSPDRRVAGILPPYLYEFMPQGPREALTLAFGAPEALSPEEFRRIQARPTYLLHYVSVSLKATYLRHLKCSQRDEAMFNFLFFILRF